MNLKNSITTLKTLAFSLVFFSTTVEADLKQEISRACSDYQSGEDKSLVNGCKLYIDGFIDSAILSATATLGNSERSQKKLVTENAFFRRAIETRLGEVVSRGTGDTTYEFCIPKNAERSSIASTIAKSMDISSLNEKPLKHILFTTLVSNFPCK